MDLTEQQLSSTQVYQGHFLKVSCDSVRLPDGKTATREYIQHPGAVAILALNQAGELILERQYRYPLGRSFIEIPAGKMDADESHADTARRELWEETGYTAEHWSLLGSAYPCIGYSNEVIHYYLAEGLQQNERQLDDGEFIEVLALPLDEVLAMAGDGRISDSKSIVGLSFLRARLATRYQDEPG